ncbi:hypothetical protein [uncultured Clostridium sp.]|nr:hypothetical protein [uncultured Clostridium sp.]
MYLSISLKIINGVYAIFNLLKALNADNFKDQVNYKLFTIINLLILFNI